MKYKFIDICSKIGSGATPRGGKEAYCAEGITLIRSQNVLDFKMSYDGLVYINDEQAKKLNNVEVQKGDILLNITGDSVARCCIVNCDLLPARVNQHVAIIRGKNNFVLNNYLLYFLQYNKKYLLQLASSGATRNALTKNMIENLEIDLPALEEQQKITSILSALDEKIEVNQKINENLEEQAQAIYEKLFMQNLNNDRVYCKIEDVFEISIGKTPPRKEKQWFSNDKNDYIWISISDMKDCGLYISDSSEYLTFDAIEKHNVKIIPDNTVILSFKLTVGRVAITDGITTTNEAIAHFKTDNKSINEYLYFYLKNFNYQSLGSTSSIATAINSKIVKKIPFILPTEKEIQYFSDIVSPMFKQIKNNQHEIVKLCKIRDVLLPKLMNGEIDVSDIKI